MLRGGEAPLWPDATTRFPVLLLSHGYGGSPISNDYLLALNVFASFGYVVVAPFHTDATFSDLRNLDGFLDFFYLVTHLEQFNAMQALRPLALSATLDLVLAQPQWRDRVDATQVGGFGASMGAESMLLLAGAELTTTVTQASDARHVRPSTQGGGRLRAVLRADRLPRVRPVRARARRRDAVLPRHRRDGRHHGAAQRDVARHRPARRTARARRAHRREAPSSTCRRSPTSSRGR